MKFAITNEMDRRLEKQEVLILKSRLKDFIFIRIPKDCKEVVLRSEKRKEED